MTCWTICPHRVQMKSFCHTSRDSTTGDVKASVFCNVSARSRHFVNVDVIFSLLCVTASAFQHSRLATGVEISFTSCMDNPRSCSAGVDEMSV